MGWVSSFTLNSGAKTSSREWAKAQKCPRPHLSDCSTKTITIILKKHRRCYQRPRAANVYLPRKQRKEVPRAAVARKKTYYKYRKPYSIACGIRRAEALLKNAWVVQKFVAVVALVAPTSPPRRLYFLFLSDDDAIPQQLFKKLERRKQPISTL